MISKSIQIEYKEYASEDLLSEEDQQLVNQARLATNKAYAPYSGFKVGASAMITDNQVIIGSNQENASYPLCLCAERVCLAAISSLHTQATLFTMAVTAVNPKRPVDQPVSPCGACRQVLLEAEQRQGSPIRIILFGETGPIYIINSAADLLPLGFDSSYLK